MFSALLKNLFKRTDTHPAEEIGFTPMSPDEIMGMSDRHAAIVKLRQLLQREPANLDALNNLAACLADVGNKEEATSLFELAHSLDDSFIPATVNHASVLVERDLSAQALPYLEWAKLAEPYCGHADLVYSSYCFARGDLERARHFKLKGWLSNFDNLRYANGHLWYVLYGSDEKTVAMEHRFWADTLLPCPDLTETAEEATTRNEIRKSTAVGGLKRKLRIGYWSPDFHNHSVRYFSRPLIQNHNRELVQVYIYHDRASEDEQTQSFRDYSDSFHDVSVLNDSDFVKLVRSHNLDVLVELAGHSSYNRITLLKLRLAKLQVSALGYPPTTGLTTIDAKVVDPYIDTPERTSYYTEAPLVLPHTFWCFDPMEEANINPQPPLERNGYVTFACVGNVSKISREMLSTWNRILASVPRSILLLRSVTFRDDAVVAYTKNRLVAAGLPESQLVLRRPEGGAAFFDSYNEIDIVLDTFPFNGGTTTCFATYMGVPVVSLFGKALASRMGLSILSNLNIGHLAVDNIESYVQRAVEIANQPEFLRKFRKDARLTYKASSLGNGQLFASDFENACLDLLEKHQHIGSCYVSTIDPLPEQEIIRRAYQVMQFGQHDAAQRILDYCLFHYPNAAAAHLLVTQKWIRERNFETAAKYLQARIEQFNPVEQMEALISLCRLYLLMEDKLAFQNHLNKLTDKQNVDSFNAVQVELFHAASPSCQVNKSTTLTDEQSLNIEVLIVCDDLGRFEEMRNAMQVRCRHPLGWQIDYIRCNEASRHLAYQGLLEQTKANIVVIVQKNINVYSPDFFYLLSESLQNVDVLSFAGSRVWSRIDWRAESFTEKAAGYIIESSERKDFLEIQWAGIDSGAVNSSMVILDGGCLAFTPATVQGIGFESAYEGSKTLLEEVWTHEQYLAKRRLAVHRDLGVFIDANFALDESNRREARLAVKEKYSLPVFDMRHDDLTLASVPVSSTSKALAVMTAMCSR